MPEIAYPDSYPEPVPPHSNAPAADLPYFPREAASAMLPPAAAGACPHCGTMLLSAGQRAQDGDAGICISCLAVVISEAGAWRVAKFDEAAAWDADVRVQAARAIWPAWASVPEGV